MKPPIFNPFWPDQVKAIHAHDMQEMWDARLAPHLFNCYHDELGRYLAIAGRAPLRILDVGCAQATLSLLLAEAGHRVTAVDLRPEFLDYARTRYEKGEIDFVQGNVMELDLLDRLVLVFANQLLEHLVYPVEMIRGLSRLLRPGGRFVATTPSGLYLKSSLPLYRELGNPDDYRDRQFFPDGDGHFFAYSPGELREIAVEAGLAQVQVAHYATPWITGHMRVRHLHGRVPVGVLRALDRLCLSGPRWLVRKWAYQLMLQGVRPDE